MHCPSENISLGRRRVYLPIIHLTILAKTATCRRRSTIFSSLGPSKVWQYDLHILLILIYNLELFLAQKQHLQSTCFNPSDLQSAIEIRAISKSYNFSLSICSSVRVFDFLSMPQVCFNNASGMLRVLEKLLVSQYPS